MNQNTVFEKIADDFNVTFDAAQLTKDWPIMSAEKYMIITDPTGKPHWQRIGSILFGRNFPKAYPVEANAILDELKRIQSELRKKPPSDSPLLSQFLNHTLQLHRVNITKIESGVGENIHFDKSRATVVNMGVINSATCITHAWTMDGPLVPGGLINERSIKYTYQHKDREVYLLNTGAPHSVDSLVTAEDQLDRYVLGYLLTDRDPTDLPRKTK